MNILVINGSPRKKDGFRVVNEIESYIKVSSKVKIESIDLVKEDIQTCQGCMACFHKGEGYCPLKKDSVEKIRQKMIRADGIILLTPVYALHITGVMKCFIDRLSYMFHRPELINKPVLGIVTTGGGGQHITLKYLKMVGTCWGGRWISGIDVVGPLYFKESPYYNRTYEYKKNSHLKKLANEYSKALNKRGINEPTLYQIIMFQGLKSKTYIMEADYNYWTEKGWLDKLYYDESELGVFKKIVSIVLANIVRSLTKKMFHLNGKHPNYLSINQQTRS